jgi:hypothetical protein
MDVSAIASLATNMASALNNQAIGIAVLKKALDTETAGAAGLLAAVPSAPSGPNLPSHLGQNINTTA